MDPSYLDLEFFDLSNASEEEIKEIRSILSDSGSNGCVELPWEIPFPFAENTLEEADAAAECGKPHEVTSPSTTASTLGAVVGQTLMFAPPQVPQPPPLAAPATQLSIQTTDVLPPVEAFVPQVPPMSAASAIGPHYPAPYLVPRTLPYLRAYPPHVGVPLFTCTLPGAGELTHVPSPYTPFLPVAAPLSAVSQPPSDKLADSKEISEVRHKSKSSGERQFYHHHNRKKNVSTGSYYSPPDFIQGVDAYQDSSASDDRTLVSASEHLSAVPSSLPVVPVPVTPSTFSVTSGALPMPSYPPGLHPLHYSQISGPQAPTTPLYYVPVFNHPHYSSYIPSASSHVMLPISNVSVPPGGMPHTSESQCTTSNEEVGDITKDRDSVNVSMDCSSERDGNVSPLKPDAELATQSEEQHNVSLVQEDVTSSAETVLHSETNNVSDSHCEESSDAHTETQVLANPNVDNCCDERAEKSVSHKMYNDSSRCWADLFKKQCPEVNGLDRRHSDQPSIGSTKEIANGKLYSVPNSDSVL